MRLWRLSHPDYARRFDGGFGLRFAGRWSTPSRPVTYVSTVPALCVLERLVHVDSASDMPDGMRLVAYEGPDELPQETVRLADLPTRWREDQTVTQTRGDTFLDTVSSVLLFVPSAVVPVEDGVSWNALVNHRHPAAASLVLTDDRRFDLDPRLF